MDDLRLSALLCTRLCHDLIGPAGAVVNGVELLSEDAGAVDGEVVELIRLSATETTRRLKYFRMALGVQAEGQSIAIVRAVADDYFLTSKVSLEWSDAILATAAPMPANLIAVILNVLLCGAEALPRGGRIAIDGAAGEGAFNLHITASGESIKADEDALLSLSGDRDPETLEARGIAPYMTARLVSAAGGKIAASPAENSMDYSVTLPTGTHT